MPLTTRSLPFEVPSYSLTGDILSFQRCALAYRYYNGSALPPSRPVQMWTGEFVHGVLEEAYRYWNLHHPDFPWPYTPPLWPPQLNAPLQDNNNIAALGHRVEVRLAASGKRSRSRAARTAAYNRVAAAINDLGPYLFPLITAAEERISGTREMPQLPPGEQARGSRYELTGIVDVISSIMLGAAPNNPIVDLIEQTLVNVPPGEYDLIVDYKAGRRPALDSDFRTQYELQVQTYAWLRGQIPQARTVAAGVLVYINEFSPSRDDMEELKRELQAVNTDIAPDNGSADYYAIHGWQPGQPTPQLTFEFRLRRALHIVNVTPQLLQNAVGQIDNVISHIESSAFREHNSGNIPQNWTACGGAEDCVACDFYHFCPSPAQLRAQLQQPNPPPRQPPLAPG
jgi:hypothetical protein